MVGGHCWNNNVITKHGAPVVYKSYNLTDIYTPFLFVGLTDYQNGSTSVCLTLSFFSLYLFASSVLFNLVAMFSTASMAL